MARCRPRRTIRAVSHKTCNLGYRSDFEVNGKTAVQDAKNREKSSAPLGNTYEIRFQPSYTEKNTSHISHAYIDYGTGEVIERDHLLTRWALQSAALDILPKSRLSVCYRNPISRLADGHVYRRDHSTSGRKSAYYTGLMLCGSVWQCPVCAAKISERRRAELIAALSAHRQSGGGVVMLTLTIPHVLHQSCKSVLDVLLNAFRALNSGRNALASMFSDYLGMVRALEVTHGKNGWHPHLHVLIFSNSEVQDLSNLENRIFARWEQVCMRLGLDSLNRSAAVQLQDGSAAAKYVSKNAVEGTWGAAEELTRAHLKSAGRGGRTPWAILADYAQYERLEDAELFREYAAAFKGRVQLLWSRGLRAHFALSDKTDKQLAEETTEQEDEHICALSQSVIAVMRRHRLQGQVLALARDHGRDAVLRLLACYGVPICPI